MAAAGDALSFCNFEWLCYSVSTSKQNRHLKTQSGPWHKHPAKGLKTGKTEMGLFDTTFHEFRQYMDQHRDRAKTFRFNDIPHGRWPQGASGNVVLAGDMAVELGNPREGSVASLIWTEDGRMIDHGRITLIGPDLDQCGGQSLPFGKIVLVHVSGFDQDNTFDRYREMEHLRYDINLKGYMMRGVSQYMREWSRVSREAMDGGFSLSILGGALIDTVMTRDFVQGVEVVFVTAGMEHIRRLGSVFEKAGAIIAAMNKMVEEMSFDCGSCDYQDVCDDVSELRQMRNALEQSKG